MRGGPRIIGAGATYVNCLSATPAGVSAAFSRKIAISVRVWRFRVNRGAPCRRRDIHLAARGREQFLSLSFVKFEKFAGPPSQVHPANWLPENDLSSPTRQRVSQTAW